MKYNKKEPQKTEGNKYDKIVKQINDMSISFDIRTDVRYQQGIEQGIERGELIKSILAIRNMLAEDVDHLTIVRFLSVKPAFVKKVETELTNEAEVLNLLKSETPNIEAIAKQLNVSTILVEALQKTLKG